MVRGNSILSRGLRKRCDAVYQMIEAGEEYESVIQLLRQSLYDYMGEVLDEVEVDKRSFRLRRALDEGLALLDGSGAGRGLRL